MSELGQSCRRAIFQSASPAGTFRKELLTRKVANIRKTADCVINAYGARIAKALTYNSACKSQRGLFVFCYRCPLSPPFACALGWVATR
eukprot:3315466-Pleurochrysis_carterae.AAC.1